MTARAIRPGELLPGDGPVPVAASTRRATVRIENRGRLPAYLGSHVQLVEASDALRFDRAGIEGARPALPAGASVRIDPGAAVDVDVLWP